MIKLVILLVCFSAVSAIWPIHLTINKNLFPQPAAVIVSRPTVVKVATPSIVVEKPVIVKTKTVDIETLPVAEIAEETPFEEVISVEEVPEKIVVVDTPTTIVKTVAAPTIQVRVEKPTITKTILTSYRKTLTASVPITTIQRTPTVLRSYNAVYNQPAGIYRSL